MKDKNKNEHISTTSPKLVSRRDHRRSSFRLGQTIGEKRERLETANERAAARKKDKKKKVLRVIFTSIGFAVLVAILVILGISFKDFNESTNSTDTIEADTFLKPTIEILDENASSSNNHKITSRMTTFVAQAEQSFRDLGYKPTKAVLPSGSIREVDFYLSGYSGFVKLIIDRGAAASVEDADRMLRYLADEGIDNFVYIDARIEGRAYWK